MGKRFWVGIGVLVFGCALVTVSLLIPPPGEIDNSVLVVFGEIATLSGTLIGIDATRSKK